MIFKSFLPAVLFATAIAANASIHCNHHHDHDAPLLTPEFIKEVFAPLGNGSSSIFFDNYVIEEVDWMVSNPLDEFRTNPLAGRYTNLTSFREATFNVVNDILYEPIRLGMEFEPLVTGNVAAVELRAQNSGGTPIVSKYGYAYDCRYVWVCEFNEDRMITKVRAYLDSAMVRDLVTIDPDAPVLPGPSPVPTNI